MNKKIYLFCENSSDIKSLSKFFVTFLNKEFGVSAINETRKINPKNKIKTKPIK